MTEEQAKETAANEMLAYYPDVRNLSIAKCELDKDTEAQCLLYDDLGVVDFANEAWKVSFEHLRNSRWEKRIFYVVEPKPGPYILG